MEPLSSNLNNDHSSEEPLNNILNYTYLNTTLNNKKHPGNNSPDFIRTNSNANRSNSSIDSIKESSIMKLTSSNPLDNNNNHPNKRHIDIKHPSKEPSNIESLN